ncbi:MAG: lysine--tRNA ligase [Rhodospirillales bacterium]|nr:lysine--tRNA ligase [Rhodospirillales bacterium]
MTPVIAVPDASEIRAAAHHAKSWPFVEARRILERIKGAVPPSGAVLFETGYGPSGLPHIGTFGEVVRTTMVRNAFAALSDMPTRLIAFSDDMDGLRKVPDNIPNPERLAPYLGQPLTRVPDPFGEYESFGHHNNARLRGFLDQFGFDYEFVSATDCYTSGRFDGALRQVLRHYDAILAVILPTLGPERRATYSPFLPVSARTGAVLQVPVLRRDEQAGTIVYEDEDGRAVETEVTGGRCKLQWKADWAMRWFALGVDYEMAGKDLIDSVRLSSRICRILGGSPPVNLIYELFLDRNGEKISKSRGNGLAVEDWLAYAPPESLSLFMYQRPQSAKRLHFDVIPRAVDEYLDHLEGFGHQDPAKRLDNPVWHIHGGQPPATEETLSFNVLLNLASVCHAEAADVLWRFVSRYRPGVSPASSPRLDRLVRHAVAYYHDVVKPAQVYRRPTAEERDALADLADTLGGLPDGSDAETIQTAVYEVGKRHGCFADLKSWFRALYQILLGQDEGPRMGSFFAVYGLAESIALIRSVIAGGDRADGAA